jgi:hypothetical protein
MNTLIRLLLPVLTFAFLGKPACAADAKPKRRPNVLFILCDDIRWNAMSPARGILR